MALNNSDDYYLYNLEFLFYNGINFAVKLGNTITTDNNTKDIIFRFEKGRIVELWDLGQPVPEISPNQYGIFQRNADCDKLCKS
jgi:hypothetical protein